jgi:alkyl hydroperoxide reductase 1
MASKQASKQAPSADRSIEFKNKKAVVVAVPGAFTPTCSAMHLPPYIQKLSDLKSKGVDEVLFIAYNDPFVMSAWGKANGVKDNSIVGRARGEDAFGRGANRSVIDLRFGYRHSVQPEHGLDQWSSDPAIRSRG